MPGLVPANGLLQQAFGNEAPIQAADVGATTLTTLTDSTTGSAAATVAAGVGYYNLTFQFDLADIADGDLVTDLVLNHKFKIIESYFVATEPVTTGSKATTLSLDIGTTAVTNSAIALTSLNCTPAGAKVQNAGALSVNTGSASAVITVKAASTTAFSEGKGVLVICIQNMDTADAFATLIAEQAKTITELTEYRTNLRAANLMA